MECPWCNKEVEIVKGRCPNCRNKLYEVTEEDFTPDLHNESTSNTEELSVIEVIEDNFKCSKCNGNDCTVKEIAMTGAGLSKLLDIQHNHYLFVSCMNCGSVEIYDPNVLEGQKVGKLGSIIDVLFG
ncbi:zinc ribbon domain-containing protein [Paenibacillus lupini]|uniref:zinc ribbon domain-containing protein n=1 Tax=Paenibacillus lupini TaxID=1450204 RepID=UPI001421F4EF|nr:zinc ribbon domain-containing protein [Paenibacillus lupini]NIK21515.1 putative nucleic-acid-binding Zn-ribbon protein [Paenibacillus lupini]